LLIFFVMSPPPSRLPPLSLHDALPIYPGPPPAPHVDVRLAVGHHDHLLTAQLATQDLAQRRGRPGELLPIARAVIGLQVLDQRPDRKSTRLNSSHDQISYAVFCLKKKK